MHTKNPHTSSHVAPTLLVTDEIDNQSVDAAEVALALICCDIPAWPMSRPAINNGDELADGARFDCKKDDMLCKSKERTPKRVRMACFMYRVTVALRVPCVAAITVHAKLESEVHEVCSQAEFPTPAESCTARGLDVPNEDPYKITRAPPDDKKLPGNTAVTTGATTLSGSAPFATPYSAVPGFVIATDAIESTLSCIGVADT